MELSQEFDRTFLHIIAAPAALVLSQVQVRQALRDAIEAAQSRAKCQGILIRGPHSGVSSGATYTERAGDSVDSPSLLDLCAAVETSTIPVVFLLSGPVRSGVFDLAMSAHCRLADQSLRIDLTGWDEHQLAAVGTSQRLARLLGAQKTVEMMKGTQIGPLRSAKLGLIAGVAKGNLINAARKYMAGQIEKGNRFIPPIQMQTGIADALMFQNEISELSIGGIDPFEQRLIQAVEVAHMFPTDQALAFEHASFAEFQAFDGYAGCEHLAGLRQQRTPHRGVHGALPRVAIVHGSDQTMRWAELCAFHDLKTQILVPSTGDQSFLAAWKAKLEAMHLNGAIDGARRSMAEAWVITDSAEMAADVIIDTHEYGGQHVPQVTAEYMHSNVLYVLTSQWISHRTVMQVCPQGQAFGTLILSSNAKLMEWSSAPDVPADRVKPIFALAAELGCSLITANHVVGGPSRWMEHAFIHALEEALDQGGSLDVLDDIFLQKKGWHKGPYQYFDHKDLEDIVAKQKSYLKTLPVGAVYPDVLERYCAFAQENGQSKPRLFAQTAAGYMANPMLQSLLGQAAAVDHNALYEGIIARLCHQGCRLIGHGVIADAASADLISVDALGFPAQLGGVMKEAQNLGLSRLLDLHHQKAQFDPSMAPTQVLINAVQAGGSF